MKAGEVSMVSSSDPKRLISFMPLTCHLSYRKSITIGKTYAGNAINLGHDLMDEINELVSR